ETGDRNAATRAARETDSDHTSVVDLDVTGHELATDERRLDSELHVSAAFRTEPSEAASRERAASASTPARSDTSATRASPAAASSAWSTRSSEAPLARTTL